MSKRTWEAYFNGVWLDNIKADSEAEARTICQLRWTKFVAELIELRPRDRQSD